MARGSGSQGAARGTTPSHSALPKWTTADETGAADGSKKAV